MGGKGVGILKTTVRSAGLPDGLGCGSRMSRGGGCLGVRLVCREVLVRTVREKGKSGGSMVFCFKVGK